MAGETQAEAATAARKGLAIERVWTTEGVHPYDEVTWERRDVVMTNWRDGSINFEQRGVEFPDFWSVNAANIVTTKYFRGAVGTPEREWSLKGLIDRVVSTYQRAGEENGYFATPGRRGGLRPRTDLDAAAPGVQLQLAGLVQRRHLLAAAGVRLLHPRRRRFDGLDSRLVQGRRLDLQGRLGLRASTCRGSVPPASFFLPGARRVARSASCAGADASAGTIKSGGATRRAAKMVILDVDHPDVEEFIETKAREENKIRALRDAGFDMDLGGKDIVSVQYQNANNSVRVSEEFMRSIEDDTDFALRARLDGSVVSTVNGRTPVPQDRPGRVGVRRPGHPVRRHHQRLAHLPGDRPDHRVQPVQRVHAPGQLVVQPGVAQPAEVPGRRQHVRGREVRQVGRVRHHRDGHLDLLRRLPDREDRRDHAGLPAARHRLRQPRRAAHGQRPGLRLGRRPGGGGDDHQPDDGHAPTAARPRWPAWSGAYDGLRPQRQAAHAGHAQARGGQRRDRHRRRHRRRHQGRGDRPVAARPGDRRAQRLAQRAGQRRSPRPAPSV